MDRFTRTKGIFLAVSLIISLAACGNNSKNKNSAEQDNNLTSKSHQAEYFPSFKGEDFEENKLDNSIFKKNDFTLLNFWFNECSACISEMPALDEFNKKLRDKNVELMGVNVGLGSDKEALDQAKKIVSKQGVTYTNLIIDDKQDARAYVAKIFSFPTTIIVDKDGKIVGEPIIGNIDGEDRQKQILDLIDKLKSGEASDIRPLSSDMSGVDKVELARQKILAAENNIFFANKAIWDKLFNKMNKTDAEKNQDMDYVKYLKAEIKKNKDEFDKKDLKILEEDLLKIKELEDQLKKLEEGN